ncbi:MAG: A/G-specific adenine glycosylase [Candidatus Aminicenantes bacterium]|nr:A/G-specific adenine glycosylase [Candidatus Aminicenantes bacterium]
MTNLKKRVFRTSILRWYASRKRDLPWRRTSDPYAIWVSEVMLQQTTVSAVIPYYEKWRRLFPDIGTLARAPLQKVLRAWQGLGYYARARNMHRAAREVVRRFGGRLPAEAAALRALPGFGPYTTAAVLSISAGRPVPVVEANVRRVMMRLLGIRGRAEAKHDRRILVVLEEAISRRAPGRFNQAMMELGALVCRSGNPLCLACPIQAFCAAYKAGTQERIPAPKQTSTIKVEAVVAVIRRGGKVLIQKRPPTGLLAGLWEFPGGKLKPGESLRAALAREIREELGIGLAGVRPLITVQHAYTQYEVTLHAYEGRVRAADLSRLRKRPDGLPRRWVSPAALGRYPFPSGSAKIIRFLERQ